MNAATITMPKTKAKANTKSPVAKKLKTTDLKETKKKSCGSSAHCDNCKAKTKRKKTSKKKKPMFKLGSWRGAFKGTLDF